MSKQDAAVVDEDRLKAAFKQGFDEMHEGVELRYRVKTWLDSTQISVKVFDSSDWALFIYVNERLGLGAGIRVEVTVFVREDEINDGGVLDAEVLESADRLRQEQVRDEE